MNKIKIFLKTILIICFTLVIFACNKEYTIKVTCDSEKGTVVITEETKDNIYEENENITIVVNPKTGYKIDYFIVNGKKIVDTNEYAFKINENVEYEVVFKKDGYGINLEYNETLGSVILTPKKDVYNVGDEIIIAVLPNENVKVDTFIINGKEEQLDNNSYSFVITEISSENYEIKVSFNQLEVPTEMPEEAVKSLQGRIKFEGYYFYNETGVDYDTDNAITTIFGTDAIHQVETDGATGEVYYDTLYVNNNGVLAQAYRTIDNVIEKIDSEDQFVDFYNPFDNLTASDFTYVEDYVFEITDKELAKIVATNITGWNESIETFYVELDEDFNVVMLLIKTEEITIDEEVSYVSEYEFSVLEHGTAEVDPQLLAPYERTEGHDELDAALEKAENAKNYTIRHFDHEEGWEDLDYNVYVTERAIYSDCLDWESGYVLDGGLIYPFEYDPATGKATLTDPISEASSMDDIQGWFTGFNVALFENKGDGVFVLRDNGFASTIAQYFAEGIDEMQQYYYATNLTIVIKDGQLYQVMFTYSTYGITADVTLTYSNFDNTELPITFDNLEKVSVLDSFMGSYRDENGNFAIVSESGVIINGSEFVVADYDKDYDMLIGTWNDEVFYINKLSEKQLYISNEDYSITYTLNTVEEVEVEISTNYKGVWENSDHNLVIKTRVVLFDGKELKLLSFGEEDGIIAVDGNITYCFALEEGAMLVISIEGDMIGDTYSLTKTSKPIGVDIPIDYVGMYETRDGSEIIVNITNNGITIDGIVFDVESYDETNGFIGTYNGITGYSLVASGFSSDMIYFGTEDENYMAYRLITINGLYIGEWQSTIEDAKYFVTITEHTVTINRVLVEVTYNHEYGYTGTYNGETIYIKHIISAVDGSDCLVLYSDTFSAVLVPVETN